MGNCAGYCTGCKEDSTARYDNNQVRNSYKEKDMIVNAEFGGERYSATQSNNFGNPGYNNNGQGGQPRQMKRPEQSK
jgi:hypothetical protein